MPDAPNPDCYRNLAPADPLEATRAIKRASNLSAGRRCLDAQRERDHVRGEVRMVTRCIASLSLDLLHFLSICFDEFHDLVSEIVPNTNWGA